MYKHNLRRIAVRLTQSGITGLIAMVLTGCAAHQPQQEAASEPVPHVVTDDIAAGIENHINTITEQHDGQFPLTIEDEKHQLQLVKIHKEYLATLGTNRHFACVDLVDRDGDVYDVDFFLEGEPGSMTVTKTLPHKCNGKPYYFWKQKEDGTWGRVPVTDASRELMGVIVPRDAFSFRYRISVPELSAQARLWVPLAETDDFQDVTVNAIEAPRDHRILTGKTYGNKILFWELKPEDGGAYIDVRYDVVREEKGAYSGDAETAKQYLSPSQNVPQNPQLTQIATNVTAGKSTDLRRARALYDHVIDTVRYAKAGEGWGEGNAMHACNAQHGNCTDYHAYFIGLARAIDIPARFAIGVAIPSHRDEGGISGYHCWVEFFAKGKWWPVDISEADKYSALATYYFGHHPANRLEFSRGRDLVVEPGPSSGPINFLAYPILEVDGQSKKADVSFSFKRH